MKMLVCVYWPSTLMRAEPSELIGCFPFVTSDSMNNIFCDEKIRQTSKDAYAGNQNIILSDNNCTSI